MAYAAGPGDGGETKPTEANTDSEEFAGALQQGKYMQQEQDSEDRLGDLAAGLDRLNKADPNFIGGMSEFDEIFESSSGPESDIEAVFQKT